MVVLIIYVMVSIVLTAIFLTNLKLIRNRSYKPTFQITNDQMKCVGIKKTLKGVSYWMVHNNNSVDHWIVFLHGWWKDSRRNFKKAKPFWQHGYSLLFVDAKAHGQSKFKLVNNGFLYAMDVHKILKYEKITQPVILGTSYGATAASIYAAIFPTDALILESLSCNLISLFHDFFRYLRVPKFLFGWVPYIVIIIQEKSVRNKNLDSFHPDITLEGLKIPIYLIHGENDRLFPIKKHFLRLEEKLKKNPRAKFWLVPKLGHSKLDTHSYYEKHMCDFIITLNPPLIDCSAS